MALMSKFFISCIMKNRCVKYGILDVQTAIRFSKIPSKTDTNQDSQFSGLGTSTPSPSVAIACTYELSPVNIFSPSVNPFLGSKVRGQGRGKG